MSTFYLILIYAIGSALAMLSSYGVYLFFTPPADRTQNKLAGLMFMSALFSWGIIISLLISAIMFSAIHGITMLFQYISDKSEHKDKKDKAKEEPEPEKEPDRKVVPKEIIADINKK